MTASQDVGKVVSLTHRPPYPQEILLVLISVTGWVDPRTLVRSEGLCQWKIPMTPSGIETETFRFSTAQRKWVPEIFPWSKGGRCVRLTTLPPACANCPEILGASNSWSPKSLSKRVMGYFDLYLRHYIYATSSKPSKHRLGFHTLLWKAWLQSTAHVSQQTCNSSVIWKQLII